MTEYTTIQISKELKDQLNTLKLETGRNRYDEVIEDLITGGKILPDITSKIREPIAFTLKAYRKREPETPKYFNVTYHDLKNNPSGTFIAYDFHESCYSEHAEILYKTEHEVILRVTHVELENNIIREDSEILHIRLY